VKVEVKKLWSKKIATPHSSARKLVDIYFTYGKEPYKEYVMKNEANKKLNKAYFYLSLKYVVN